MANAAKVFYRRYLHWQDFWSIAVCMSPAGDSLQDGAMLLEVRKSHAHHHILLRWSRVLWAIYGSLHEYLDYVYHSSLLLG